jgi:hypothetical protein
MKHGLLLLIILYPSFFLLNNTYDYPSFFPMMFFLVIHHFFPIFQEKQDILTAPWQPLGDFRAKLTPEVLPAAKSHFIAEELQPRAAEVQNKHEKTR